MNRFIRRDGDLKANPVIDRMLFGVTLLSIILLVILVLQLSGLYRNYQFYIITGSESMPIYSIWEIRHGYPLYQWPFKDHYQLTLYNFGFYYIYSFILGLFEVNGPEIMLYGRLITAVFSLSGAAIQLWLIRVALDRALSARELITISFLCFCTWFNSYLPGYYDLSVRSDVLAVNFCVLATFFVLRYLKEEKHAWLLLAVLAWVVAWCVKQSSIYTIVGVSFYLLICRRWSALAMIVALYGVFTAFILFGGSAEYRWNILSAPRVEGFNFFAGAVSLGGGVLLSLFGWSAIVTLPMLLGWESRGTPRARIQAVMNRMRPKGDLASIGLLGCIVLAGSPLAALTLCRKGASLNYMFEVFVIASSLSYILFARLGFLLSEQKAVRLSYVAGGLLLSMCVFPTAQLAMHRIGPMARATREDSSEKRDFAAFLTSLPKPVLIDDETWSLPWFAGNGRDPVIKVDPIWYPDAVNKGLIQGGGFEGLIARHWYGSIYINNESTLYKIALAAGYRIVPIPMQFTRYKDSLGRWVDRGVLLEQSGRTETEAVR